MRVMQNFHNLILSSLIAVSGAR